MFLRRHYRRQHWKRQAYWALVESYRTERGPRQRVVSYLGQVEEPLRRRVVIAASSHDAAAQLPLPGVGVATPADAEWVEVDIKRVRIERSRACGGAWIGLQVAERLGLPAFLREQVRTGGEEIPWPLMTLVLVLGRLCEPGSELSLAEQGYERTALPELLGVPAAKVNDDRLYRALDRLLPSKPALEKQPKTRLGELFGLEYDLLLYDVTSTFFEGKAAKNRVPRPEGTRRGAAGLLARPAAGLQAGVYRPGGQPRGDAARLRGVRREPQRCHDGERDRGEDRGAVWDRGPHLGDGSWDGVEGEPGVLAGEAAALHRGHAEEPTAPLRGRDRRPGVERSAYGVGSQALSRPGRQGDVHRPEGTQPQRGPPGERTSHA